MLGREVFKEQAPSVLGTGKWSVRERGLKENSGTKGGGGGGGGFGTRISAGAGAGGRVVASSPASSTVSLTSPSLQKKMKKIV